MRFGRARVTAGLVVLASAGPCLICCNANRKALTDLSSAFIGHINVCMANCYV